METFCSHIVMHICNTFYIFFSCLSSDCSTKSPRAYIAMATGSPCVLFRLQNIKCISHHFSSICYEELRWLYIAVLHISIYFWTFDCNIVQHCFYINGVKSISGVHQHCRIHFFVFENFLHSMNCCLASCLMTNTHF